MGLCPYTSINCTTKLQFDKLLIIAKQSVYCLKLSIIYIYNIHLYIYMYYEIVHMPLTFLSMPE